MHLTVIIPTYRRTGLLERALCSVLAQDWQDWDAVVVDDGDGAGIETAHGVEDERVAAVPNEGRGQVDARSTALARARGELVCWLDDDDWWDDPGHLSQLAAVAAEEPGCFFFRGGWIVHADGSREAFDHEATARSLRRNNTVLTSSPWIRTWLASSICRSCLRAKRSNPSRRAGESNVPDSFPSWIA